MAASPPRMSSARTAGPVGTAMPGSSEVDSAGTVFALGMSAMLVVPLLIAVCVVRSSWRRSSHKRLLPDFRVAAADSDDEEEALRPKREKPSADLPSPRQAAQAIASKISKCKSRRGPLQYEQKERSLVPVHFRKPGWKASDAPLLSKVAFEHLRTLQVRSFDGNVTECKSRSMSRSYATSILAPASDAIALTVAMLSDHVSMLACRKCTLPWKRLIARLPVSETRLIQPQRDR